MADIFNNQPGLAVAIDSPGIPVSLFIQGWPGSSGAKSIVTQFVVQQQGGVQFMHTLRDFIYIYVFGERIGSMQISGVSFAGNCAHSSCHGLEYVNQYYLANRISNTGAPVSVVLGCGTPFYGFLTGVTINFNNPELLIGQFTLDLKVIPEASNLG